METLESRRDRLVALLRAKGISNPEALRALREVPRHRFLPEGLAEFAYQDTPLPIAEGQTISQPFIVAWMTQAAELKASDTGTRSRNGVGVRGRGRVAHCVRGVRHRAPWSARRVSPRPAHRAGLSECPRPSCRWNPRLAGACPVRRHSRRGWWANQSRRRSSSSSNRAERWSCRWDQPTMQELVRIRRLTDGTLVQRVPGGSPFRPAHWRGRLASRPPIRLGPFPRGVGEGVGRAASTTSKRATSIRCWSEWPELAWCCSARQPTARASSTGCAPASPGSSSSRHGFHVVAVEADWPDAARG